jgi:hypothetical protein
MIESILKMGAACVSQTVSTWSSTRPEPSDPWEHESPYRLAFCPTLISSRKLKTFVAIPGHLHLHFTQKQDMRRYPKKTQWKFSDCHRTLIRKLPFVFIRPQTHVYSGKPLISRKSPFSNSMHQLIAACRSTLGVHWRTLQRVTPSTCLKRVCTLEGRTVGPTVRGWSRNK